MLKRLNGEGKPLSTCGKGAKHKNECVLMLGMLQRVQ